MAKASVASTERPVRIRSIARPVGGLSIAEGGDGNALAARVALTLDAADAAALDGAGPGSKIDLHDCNG